MFYLWLASYLAKNLQNTFQRVLGLLDICKKGKLVMGEIFGMLTVLFMVLYHE